MSHRDIREALIYTNKHNEVAYVNLPFLRMMRFDRTRLLVGLPLAHALQVPTETIITLKDRAMQDRHAQLLMELIDGEWGSMYVLLNTTPSIDESRSFIGLNITFTPVDDPTPIRRNERVVSARVTLKSAAILPGTGPLNPTSDLAQQYIIAQVEGLQTFIARIMGMGVRNRMEETINQAAQKQGWPIRMTNGQIRVSGSGDAWQAALLDTAVRYSIYVVGRTWTLREIRRIEQQLAPVVIEQAQVSGIRSTLI